MRNTYYDFIDDPHLAELVRSAESRRKWYWRINWGPVLGGLIAIGVSSLAWWALIKAVIYVKGW